VGLPPDLARLGDELVDAAGRISRARRAQRRRVAAGVVGGALALAFAALSPAPLDPSHRGSELVIATSMGCEHPGDAHLRLVACAQPMVLHRPYAIN
jgi:hypothetical protein